MKTPPQRRNAVNWLAASVRTMKEVDHAKMADELMQKVVELQQGLSELSVKVDTAKGENNKLREDNVVLKDYLNNLMTKVGKGRRFDPTVGQMMDGTRMNGMMMDVSSMDDSMMHGTRKDGMMVDGPRDDAKMNGMVPMMHGNRMDGHWPLDHGAQQRWWQWAHCASATTDAVLEALLKPDDGRYPHGWHDDGRYPHGCHNDGRYPHEWHDDDDDDDDDKDDVR